MPRELNIDQVVIIDLATQKRTPLNQLFTPSELDIRKCRATAVGDNDEVLMLDNGKGHTVYTATKPAWAELAATV